MKKRLMILCTVLLVLLLSGCVKKPKNEAEILEDLSGSDYLPVSGLELDEIEVTQRRTDKKNKTDLVYVDVGGEIDDTQYKLSYICDYLYFDKGGWILQDARANKQEEWSVDPVRDSVAQNDIQSHDSTLLYDVQITKCTGIAETASMTAGRCVKRLSFEGIGQGYHCDADVEVSYELTADGWRYLSHNYNYYTVYPEYGVSTQEAEWYAQQVSCLPVSEISTESYWDYGEEVHYLVSYKEYEYLTIETTIMIYYVFDQEMRCWTVEDYQELGNEYLWDVDGTWFVEGRQEPDKILFPKGFDYRIDLKVTQLDSYTFQVDYDCVNPIVPWSADDEVLKGTVYVDVSQTKENSDHEWIIKTEMPHTNDTLLFHMDNGVSITHFSWGSYEKKLERLK